MPCVDPESSDLERAQKVRHNERVEAMLCAVLGELEAYPDFRSSLLGGISKDKSGISKRDVEQWWENHKEKDRKRLARECKEALDELNEIEFMKKRLEERAKALYVDGRTLRGHSLYIYGKY